jgi:hypothetical protein
MSQPTSRVPRARARRLRRVLELAALAAVSAWALYLVAMNVFLRTRLFRSLVSANPDVMLVDYTSAYSLVPGRIHVERLSIRGRDPNVEWILTLDRCDFRVWPLDLFHRRFHASHVRGDGLALRARLREPSFTPDHAAALPPIPGFSDPPYSGIKPPPITDEEYDLWSAWLEDMVAEHVRELWIDTVRSTGDLDVRGDWYFKPVRWLDVGPATVDVRTLDVSHGEGETWIRSATGQVVATVHPGDVRGYAGGNVLDVVSVSADLSGLVHGRPVVRRLLGRRGVTLDDGAAPFEAHLELDHGVLSPATLGLSRLALDAKGVVVRVPSMTLTTPLLLVKPAGVLGRVRIDAPDVELPSAARLGALLPLPSGVVVEGGHASGAVRVDVDLVRGTAAGTAHLLGRAVSVRVGDLVLRGNADVHVHARQDGAATDLSGSTARFREPAEGGWWADVELPQATLALARPGLRLQACAIARAKDATPVVSLIASHADVAAKVALGAIPTTDLRASGEIVLAPSLTEARSVVAETGAFRLDLELLTRGRQRDAAVVLALGPVRAGVDVSDGGTDVFLNGVEPWFVARVNALRAMGRSD